MTLNTKITASLVAGSGVILILVIAFTLLAFREFSLIMARDHVRTAAEVVRVHLTESMVNGTINKREAFFHRLSAVDGLMSSRVVRGPEVVRQFGNGLTGEAEGDDLEREVIATGQSQYLLMQEMTTPIFRATIPFTAESAGSPNCLQCHKVPEHTVLGAITLTLSLEQIQRRAIHTILLTLLSIFGFTVVTVWVTRRLLSPLVTTAEQVQGLVTLATQGNFSGEIEVHTRDEIGRIATDLNLLMTYLREGLGRISQQTAHLIRYDLSPHSNMLDTTIQMVETLVDVARFKQAIEEDETRKEVFDRLTTIWRQQFGVQRYSLYEVLQTSNRMQVISVDHQTDAGCIYCDPQILVRADTCRCRRTGHAVDSIDHSGICTAFRSRDEQGGSLRHYCIPVLQSGVVGSVVQFITNDEEAPLLHHLIPFLRIFLEEAAPVIETKRLMDTLRESSLRDAMTGLHNRRFLEEFVETIINSAQRRQMRLSILMLDVDYFKKVNDTYGHEAGDTVLKSIARILTRSVRASDLVIRYGGEEFTIILQDTTDHTATEVAEKIRQNVEDEAIHLPGVVLKKTISIGIADFPDDSDTFWQAVKFADVALYRAKEEGRNRVVHFQKEMWTQDEY